MIRPELRPLTSVRGLFAWAVVLYHVRLACTSWLAPGVMTVLSKGYLAVDFFFLLSGFVIWLNYGERLRGRTAVADFLVRRFARVWPLHAAMLAFAALIAVALLATGRPAPTFPFTLLPIHLMMLQDWGFADALIWNDPAWSISAEWAAYLLAPIAALLVAPIAALLVAPIAALPLARGRGLPTLALLIVAAVPLLALHIIIAVSGGIKLGFDLSHFGVIRCLCEFSCGAVLSILWRRWRGDTGIEMAAWATGALCFVGWAAGMAETLAVPFAFASLLLALAIGAERPRHILAGRAMHLLGEISYATYLSHFLLFFAFKLAFVSNDRAVSPAMIALFLAIVLVASLALHRGIERPFQRLILRAWKSRPAGAGSLEAAAR